MPSHLLRRIRGNPPLPALGHSDAGVRSLALSAPISQTEADAVYAKVGTLLDGAEVATLDCHVAGALDLGLVNVLARIQLVCRRRGVTLTISTAPECGDLAPMLTYFGLADALGVRPPRSDTRRESEAGE